jgi:hypothetical protein
MRANCKAQGHALLIAVKGQRVCALCHQTEGEIKNQEKPNGLRNKTNIAAAR